MKVARQLNGIPTERLRRVCGQTPTDGDLQHPVLKGIGLAVVAVGIVVAGALALLLVAELCQIYFDWIYDAATSF